MLFYSGWVGWSAAGIEARELRRRGVRGAVRDAVVLGPRSRLIGLGEEIAGGGAGHAPCSRGRIGWVGLGCANAPRQAGASCRITGLTCTRDDLPSPMNIIVHPIILARHQQITLSCFAIFAPPEPVRSSICRGYHWHAAISEACAIFLYSPSPSALSLNA